nr:hypothetical protein [Methylomarinum sp. Ch1-1]MDP4520751.1 hypothetical protein [Methylomarinum sp. Ch1-1]
MLIRRIAWRRITLRLRSQFSLACIGCAELFEAHQKRCASYRQHTLPVPVGRIKRSGSANVGRLREASRQKPPPGQNWPCTRGGV